METTPRRKHTRRLPQYRKMVEKKKTRRLPCIYCMYEQQMQGSLHVFFFSTIFPQWGSLLMCFHLGLVSILVIGSSLHPKICTKIFYTILQMEYNISSAVLSADGSHLLLVANVQKVFRHSFLADYYVMDVHVLSE